MSKFDSAYQPEKYEAEIYGAWEAAGVFRPKKKSFKDSSKGDVCQPYAIVMPPPNANGDLHIGHGLTVALQDTLIRYHRLRGEATWYVPGADHAGFETWVVYERALEKQGRTRFDFTRDELYSQVWDFVAEKRGGMELQLRAMGASCAWEDLTFTLDENVVRRVYKTFERMWKEGLVYRGEKLVSYCTKHQTAFADIEVEHEETEGILYDIAYPYDGGEIVVSTTRPETMFGDVAVAVNEKDERYKGMKGMLVDLPLTDRKIPVIFDEHADPEYGTGAVKITPGHDFNDFEVGVRHNLDRIAVIGFDGLMRENTGQFAGMTVLECRKKVVEELEKLGLLRGTRKIKHAVAKCYKCGTVIEPMLKEQWFVATEKLAKRAIKSLEGDEVRFFPASRQKVLADYLRKLTDWNISRQIPWGIPIPMFRRASSLEERSTSSEGALLAHRISNTARSVAPSSSYSPSSNKDLSSATFSSSHNLSLNAAGDMVGSARGDLEGEWVFDTRTHLAEIEIGGVKYMRDEDTFDTWFSSAHWPLVATNWEEGLENPFYPLAVMETGADILFAWVARMMMICTYVSGVVPFYEVYLHGLVLDGKGQKMSKSKGNVINPMELVGRYGSDAFRLGILRGRSAGMNQAFLEESVVAGRNLCNKLWNMSRFVQGLVDEEVKEKGYSSASLDVILQKDEMGANHYTGSDVRNPGQIGYTTNNIGEDWICREINNSLSEMIVMMREYRFSECLEMLTDLVWNKYADWFLESQKIYKNIPLLRVSLETILVMMHPFAPFVTEAIWQRLSFTDGFLAEAQFPSLFEYDEIAAEKFARLTEIVVEARRVLAEIPGGRKWRIIYGNDLLVAENAELVKRLTGVPEVVNGELMGVRLAVAGREVCIEVPEKVKVEYREMIEAKILAVGRELDGLRARMLNPRYVERAPAELVAETRREILEKEESILKLKGEMVD